MLVDAKAAADVEGLLGVDTIGLTLVEDDTAATAETTGLLTTTGTLTVC